MKNGSRRRIEQHLLFKNQKPWFVSEEPLNYKPETRICFLVSRRTRCCSKQKHTGVVRFFFRNKKNHKNSSFLWKTQAYVSETVYSRNAVLLVSFRPDLFYCFFVCLEQHQKNGPCETQRWCCWTTPLAPERMVLFRGVISNKQQLTTNNVVSGSLFSETNHGFFETKSGSSETNHGFLAWNSTISK